MYREFFGMHTDPFRVNPDPSFLYFSETHREGLATLRYAVREGKGFVVLTGEVGTGKTTLLNALLGELSDSVAAAYLFNTSLSTEDFFLCVLDELCIEPPDPFRKSAALHALNAYLIDQLEKGRQTLLVLDEAQNLSVELLEEIRMLSNLETPRSKLLQIFLVGQPELTEKLERPELRQLRQRVELFHSVAPLSVLDTAEYVRARLRLAGHPDGELFSASALHLIYQYTRGVPRLINVLCDHLLLDAYAREEREISSELVHTLAEHLGLSRQPLHQFQEPALGELRRDLDRARRPEPAASERRRGWNFGFGGGRRASLPESEE